MIKYNFETPSRQSKKGILIIFGISLYVAIKQLLVIVSVFLLRYLTSDKKIIFLNKYVLLALGLILLLMVLRAILKYQNFKFHLSKDYFILNQGILNKEQTSIAKNKIQNVYIKQNLVQQLINVVSIAIETAGDEQTEIQINALSIDKAKALKAELLQNKTNFETEDIDYNTDTVYYQVSNKKLFLEGVSENHLRSFIFILVFLLGIYNDFKDFLNSMEFKTSLSSYFQLNDKEFFSLILFNLILVLVLLFIAFLYSLIKTFIENYELRVIEKDNGLELSKGLINKVNLGLIPSRIQNTTIKTNKLKVILGLYKLSFTQAMVNKKQQKNFAIIGLNKTQSNYLIDKFYPSVLSNQKKQKPELYFVTRSVIPYLLVLIAMNIVFYFIENQLFWVNIPIIILSILSVIYGYKKSYYSINDDYIVVGSGKFIETHTDFLELHKIQAVNLRQTIFEKRRQLASLVVYSASKALTIPNIKEAHALQIKNYLLYKIETTSKSWM